MWEKVWDPKISRISKDHLPSMVGIIKLSYHRKPEELHGTGKQRLLSFNVWTSLLSTLDFSKTSLWLSLPQNVLKMSVCIHCFYFSVLKYQSDFLPPFCEFFWKNLSPLLFLIFILPNLLIAFVSETNTSSTISQLPPTMSHFSLNLSSAFWDPFFGYFPRSTSST